MIRRRASSTFPRSEGSAWVPSVGTLGIALLLGFGASPGSAAAPGEPHRPQADAVGPGDTLAAGDLDSSDLELRTRFGGLLEALRQGDRSVTIELLALGRRLADRGRDDLRRLAEFYGDMSPAGLRRGREALGVYLQIQGRVQAALDDELSGDAWTTERLAIEAELDDLLSWADGLEDPEAASLAHTFRARLAIRGLENIVGMDEAWRADQMDTAREHLVSAFDGFDRGHRLRARAEALELSGRLARIRGDRWKARLQLEESLDLALRVGDGWDQERALLGLLSLSQDAGDALARDRVLQRIARVRTPKESWPLARENAARLLERDESRAAWAALERTPPPADAAYYEWDEWHSLRAAVLFRLENYEQASAELDALEERDQAEGPRILRAHIQRALGQWDRVEELLSGAFAPEALSQASRAEAYQILGEAALGQGELDRALQSFEAAVQVAEAWERELALRPWSGSASRGVFGEWLGLHSIAHLCDLHLRLEQPLRAATRGADAQGRSLRRGDPEGEALRAAAGLDPLGGRLDEADLRAWAAHTELGLVSFVFGADFGVATWVAPDGTAHGHRIERGRSAVRQAVRRARDAASTDADARLATVGRAVLGEVLPRALLELIDGLPKVDDPGTAPRLLFLAHGPLEEFPFEVAETPAGTPLDSRLATLVLPGLPAREPGTPPSFGALGGWCLAGAPVDLPTGQDALPAAAQELADLGKLLDTGDALVGEGFRTDGLVEALATAAPMHIATHVVREDSCDRGAMAAVGLQLSDSETLCAAAILERAAPRDLVILATCESAGGVFHDGEGFHGIARAFLESGTRNLMATLWPVEDGVAHAFSLELHRGLAEGLEPSRAALRARQSLRAAGTPTSGMGAFRSLGRD